MGFKEALLAISDTGKSCTIYTFFGHAIGVVEKCDGEIFTFRGENGNVYRLYCEDIVGFAE